MIARGVVLVCLGLMLGGCRETDDVGPSIEVMPRDHLFLVEVTGDLVASESIPVSLPGDVKMSFNIVWLLPEYSEVREGEVVARFDDQDIRSAYGYSALEVLGQDLELLNQLRRSSLDLARISHEAERVDSEVEIAQTFVDVDPALFSRNEIIDALGDLEYLAVEGNYLGWQAETHGRRATAERQRIEANRSSSQIKLEKQEHALDMMELRSPADGVFVYARTPWGEKLRRGHQVYAGRPVGLLPVRGKIRARLYVPETDALGIEAGQQVTLRMHSDVNRTFGARVFSVSPVAVPKRRKDPQKYFVVETDIDAVDPDLMRIGSSVEGEILTGQVTQALLLPQQAVFFDEDAEAWVYVLEGGRKVRRAITMGTRSPTLVEITAGLEAGERVSVSAPGGGT